MSTWKLFREDGVEFSIKDRKILFWSHPDDRGRWLPKTADEFRKMFPDYSFAFYYTEETARDMNLAEIAWSADCMVILVTKHLLEHGGEELVELLRKEREANWVRMLPIGTFSREDEPEYERYFGNVQYVKYEEPQLVKEANTEYVRSTPYTRALESYIRAISMDRKLAEEIRGAFKEMVFISYRKKDHLLLEKLMRRIQSDPACQDVALWNDDYLIPGENYTGEIEEAIRKCRVFLMLVTPGLLEMEDRTDGKRRQNYVARVEYPAAKSLGKTILPIEMAPVDEKKLQAMYPELPGMGNLANAAARLSDLIPQTEDVTAEKKDPVRHSYLMGLAYLNGILVAADPAVAERFLVQSADAGNPEAMETLGTKYLQGILETDRTDTLWKMYHYQITGIEELLKRREAQKKENANAAPPSEEAAYALTLSIKQMFRNAYFLMDQCTKTEARGADAKASEVGSDILRVKKLSTIILKYRNYFDRNDDFQEPLYTQMNMIVGYEKYYSESEKKYRVGKSIRRLQWRQTGTAREHEIPLLLADVYRRLSELFEELADKSRPEEVERYRKAAQDRRILAGSLTKRF